MPLIFISYRREDTEGQAGQLRQSLSRDLPHDWNVFMDVGVPPGVNFVEAVDRALSSCEVMVVLIGRSWLTVTDHQGGRRLNDEKDLVRYEIERALARNIAIVPVLVQDATMPAASDLPDSLEGLRRHQACQLRPASWDDDVRRLMHVIRPRSSSDDLLLDFNEMVHTVGNIDERLVAVKSELCILGNDCKTAVEAKSPILKAILGRRHAPVRLKVICVDPRSAAARMLPKIDPKYDDLATFVASMRGVEGVLKHLRQKFPEQVECRYLAVLPAFGLFIADPDSDSGLTKVEMHAAKPFDPTGSRPNFIVQGKWRQFFIQQWTNYWHLAAEPQWARDRPSS